MDTRACFENYMGGKVALLLGELKAWEGDGLAKREGCGQRAGQVLATGPCYRLPWSWEVPGACTARGAPWEGWWGSHLC